MQKEIHAKTKVASVLKIQGSKINKCVIVGDVRELLNKRNGVMNCPLIFLDTKSDLCFKLGPSEERVVEFLPSCCSRLCSLESVIFFAEIDCIKTQRSYLHILSV